MGKNYEDLDLKNEKKIEGCDLIVTKFMLVASKLLRSLLSFKGHVIARL